MITMRFAAAVSCVLLAGTTVFGQVPDLARYRGYVLESNLASVAKAGGMRASDAKTMHERPVKIQQLEWRAPYVSMGSALADPVRDIAFSFYDDQLFRIVIRYERDRMEGLMEDDVIESLVGIYGVPVLSSRRTSRSAATDVDAPTNSAVVARWEDPSSSVTLFRGIDFPEFQLVVISKSLNGRAHQARHEAVRLDTEEAPQRAIEQQARSAENAKVALAKARVTNKAAFRP